jgi:hypothetical protein
MAIPAKEPPQRGPGSAPVAVAALQLPPLRQAPAAVREAGSGWGMIIVARLSAPPTGPRKIGAAWGKIIGTQGER